MIQINRVTLIPPRKRTHHDPSSAAKQAADTEIRNYLTSPPVPGPGEIVQRVIDEATAESRVRIEVLEALVKAQDEYIMFLFETEKGRAGIIISHPWMAYPPEVCAKGQVHRDKIAALRGEDGKLKA